MYKWEIIDDQTGKSFWSMNISGNDLDGMTKGLETLNAAIEKEEQKNPIHNVPDPIRNNIKKIIDSIKQIHVKYIAHAKPMVGGLVDLVTAQTEQIKLIDSFWIIAKTKNQNLVTEKCQDINTQGAKLNNLKAAFSKISFNLFPLVKTLNDRLALLQTQISKIDLNTAKAGHDYYSNVVYSTFKGYVDKCTSFQENLKAWDDAETELSNTINRKILEIQEAAKRKPGPQILMPELPSDASLQPSESSMLVNVAPKPSSPTLTPIKSIQKDNSNNSTPSSSQNSSGNSSASSSASSSPVLSAAQPNRSAFYQPANPAPQPMQAPDSALTPSCCTIG